MTKAEIIEYLYDNNVRADITIEQMAEDLAEQTEPTISKMEQVDEPMKTTDYCDICKRDMCEICVADATNPYCVPSHYEINYEPKDEPIIEVYNGNADKENWQCITIKSVEDKPQNEPKYEPQICDFCRYYNSNIPCGTTPSACKKADKFAKEFIEGLKKLKSKVESQTDDFFRNPTAEERKAVADYIDSISIPTGVNVFDLMDESQTGQPCDGCEYSKPYIEYKCIHHSCKFEDESQIDCPKSCPSRDICTKSDTDCIWRKGGI